MTERFREAREKAKALVSKMNLAEKVAQLTQYNGNDGNIDDYNPCVGGMAGASGVGSFLSIGEIQRITEKQKLVLRDNPHHVPAIFANDIVHGFRTTLPTPIAQSCSWDPEMARKCCEVAAKEAYNGGTRWTFAPMVDIARDPRWGRIVEGYGEDTFLCSDFAAASVRGFQGDSIDGIGQKGHILACMKHYAAYGACIGGRDYNSADISLQTLHDVYLPPFKAGIDAGAATVMSAFQDINGIPAAANRYLLTDILKEQWGFEGFVVSDYDAVCELVAHGVAENIKEAVEKSFGAGLDMIMCGNMYNDYIPVLIAEGRISEEDVTRSAETVVAFKYLCGLMDDPLPEEEDTSLYFCREHLTVAREAAASAVVLLENNGILPLSPEEFRGKKIAVIGPLADSKTDPLGAWSGFPDCNRTVTVLEAVREFFPESEILYELGCEIIEYDPEKTESENSAGIDNDKAMAYAAAAAKDADLVIAVVGEKQSACGEAQSRSVLALKGRQEELMRALHASGTPVVTLFSSGRPLPVKVLSETSDALLAVWQGGTEFGHGVLDVLCGRYNPSGRLTVTFPANSGQFPIYYNYMRTGRPPRDGAVLVSRYRDVSVAPLYCFGYGLSYTDFTYTDLYLSSDSMTASGEIDVHITVSNTGMYDGCDVVQLYVQDVTASRARPVKELKGYSKVFIKSGESCDVIIKLRACSLSFADDSLCQTVEPGKFRLWVAHNSADEALETAFFIV